MGKGLGIFFIIMGALSVYFAGSLPVSGGGANWGIIGGIIMFIVGAFLLAFSRSKSPRY